MLKLMKSCVSNLGTYLYQGHLVYLPFLLEISEKNDLLKKLTRHLTKSVLSKK